MCMFFRRVSDTNRPFKRQPSEVRGVFEKVKKAFDGDHSGWGVRQDG